MGIIIVLPAARKTNSFTQYFVFLNKLKPELTAATPVANRMTITLQYDRPASMGTTAVRIALAAIDQPTTDRPPNHSANMPPGNVVNR